MLCKAIALGWLTFFVPPGHTSTPVETDQYHDALGISGNTVDEWSTHIDGRSEALVEVWSGTPPYPGQPAKTLSTKTIRLYDGKIEIQRRKIMPVGEVFTVAYPTEPNGRGHALIRVDKSSGKTGENLIAAIMGGGICQSAR